MVDFMQWFTAVSIGGIFGWLSGYYRGSKDAQDVALRWIAKMDRRLDGAILRESKRLDCEMADIIEEFKR